MQPRNASLSGKALLLGLPLLVACPPPECLSSEAPTLRIGQGRERFDDLDGDPELSLEAGPQGGFRSWVAVRAEGLQAPGAWAITLRGLSQDVVIADGAQTVQSRCVSSAPGGEVVGVQFRWDGAPPSGRTLQELDGAEHSLFIEVVDEAGGLASAREDGLVLRAPSEPPGR